MLSFEIKPVTSGLPDELEVYCDANGLEILLAQLRLLSEGKTEHVHLMAESWGGNHLDDSPQDVSSNPIRHVKVLLRE